METKLSSDGYLLQKNRQKIEQSLRENCQKLQRVITKIIEFGSNNRNQTKSYNAAVTNEYENILYWTSKYYDFDVKIKPISAQLFKILEELKLISINNFLEKMDKPIIEISRCLQNLKECSQAHLRSKPSKQSNSFQSTLKYIQYLQTSINQIKSSLVVIKETASINPQQTQELPRHTLISSPVKVIRVESSYKTYSEQPFMSDAKTFSNDKIPIAQKLSQGKDSRSFEEIINQVMGLVSNADAQLSKMMHKISHTPSENSVITLNHRKMITIQNDINKTTLIVSNILQKVQDQSISSRKSISIKETQNQKCQKVQTQNEEQNNLFKADYEKQLLQLKQKLQSTQSQVDVSRQTLQDQGKKIVQKDNLIQDFKQLVDKQKSANRELLSEVEKCKTTINSLNHQIKQLKQQKSKLQQLIEQMKSKNSQSDQIGQIGELKAQVARLNNEKQELVSKCTSFQQKLNQFMSKESIKPQQQASLKPQVKKQMASSVSAIYEHESWKDSKAFQSNILQSDEDRWDNLNASDITKEDKLTTSNVQSLKKEQFTSQLEPIQNQPDPHKSLYTTFINLLESINLKSLVQEVNKSSQTMNELSKPKFRKNIDQVSTTENQLQAAKSQTVTLETNYKNLLQKLKSYPSISQSDSSIVNNSGIQECLNAFEKYLESEFALMTLNMKITIKKQQKVDAEYNGLVQQIYKLTQQRQKEQNELTKLENNLEIQRRNQQTAEEQYQNFFTQIFGSIATAQPKIKQNIETQNNQKWFNERLLEKQNEIRSLKSKLQEALNNHKNEITYLQNKITELTGQLAYQKGVSSILQKEGTQKNTKLDQLQHQNNTLKQERTRTAVTISELREQVKQKNLLQTQLSQAKLSLANTQQQLKDLNKKYLGQADQVTHLLATLQTKKTELDQQKSKLRQEMEVRISKIAETFASQKQKLEENAKQRINSLTANFNRINKKLTDQRLSLYNKQQQTSNLLAALNASLRTIYQANYRYLAKGKQHDQRLNTELARKIQNDSKYILNEQEALHVVPYCLYAIGFAEKQAQQANEYIYRLEAKMYQFKQLIDKTNQSQDFTNALKQLKTNNYSNPQNIFDEVEIAIRTLAKKSQQQINAIIVQFNHKLKDEKKALQKDHQKLIQSKQKQFKQHESQIMSKEQQIKKLSSEKEKLNLELDEQQQILKSYQQKNETLVKSQSALKLQIQALKKQNETLNHAITRNQQSASQNMQTFNQEKKELQDKIDNMKKQINIQKDELVDKTNTILMFESKVKQLESRMKDVQNRNKTSLSSQSEQNQQLKDQLRVKEDELRKKQRQLDKKQTECQKLTRDLQDTKNSLDQEIRKASSGSTRTSQLKAQIDRTLDEKKKLEQTLNKLKADLDNLQSQHNQLNNQLKIITSDKNSAITEANQLRTVLRQVELSVRQKLNLQQQINPANLSQAIRNFNPVGAIGCKLITSIIIHGYDSQRSAIINQIEKFLNRKIKRTDMSVRYPDSKSMVYNIPKEGAFIMLYKTQAGRVVGSFSQGLKKKTFIFAYWTEEEDRIGTKIREATQVEFFMPEKHSLNVSSVDLKDRSYLKYGRDELRINLMSMETISADSHVMNEKYYNDFNWTYILGDKKEDKVALEEVELHQVKFE